MRSLTRAAGAVVALFVAYVVLLVVLGLFVEGCAIDRTRARIANTMLAEVTVGDADVSLLFGELELTDLAIERSDGPHVSVTARRIEAEVASLGWLVFDRTIDHLRADGISLSISAAGAASLPRSPDRKPIHVRRMTLRNVHLEAVLTNYLPGLGRIALDIERAETGPIDLRDAVSWLFHLRTLVAKVEVTGGVNGSVEYEDGMLRLGAGLLGAEPVELPFALPVPSPGEFEVAQLGALGKKLAVEIAKVVVERGAKSKVRDWLKGRLRGGVEGVLGQ